MTKQTKSPPRSEPVTGAAKRRRTPANLRRSAGAWVQWGIRRVGEFDLCSAKYSERMDAEKVFSIWANNCPTVGIELVRVTIEPVKAKKGKHAKK